MGPYRKSRVSFLAAAVVVSVSSMVGLGIAEIALRVAYLKDPWSWRNFAVDPVNQHITNIAIKYDPIIGYIQRPDFRGGKWNTHGLMGVRLNRTLEPGQPSPPVPQGGILATGDSFTYGSEVGDDESWAARLEELLKVPVVNAGAGGYGIDQAVFRAEQLLDIVKPRAIIVSFIPIGVGRNLYSVNASLPKPYFDVVNGQLELRNVPVPMYKPSVRHIGRFRKIFGYSYALAWVAERTRLRNRFLVTGYETREEHNKGVEVTCLLWRRLADKVAGRDIKLIVLVQYAGIHVNGHDNARESPSYQVERVTECAKRAGYTVVDSYPG